MSSSSVRNEAVHMIQPRTCCYCESPRRAARTKHNLSPISVICNPATSLWSSAWPLYMNAELLLPHWSKLWGGYYETCTMWMIFSGLLMGVCSWDTKQRTKEELMIEQAWTQLRSSIRHTGNLFSLVLLALHFIPSAWNENISYWYSYCIQISRRLEARYYAEWKRLNWLPGYMIFFFKAKGVASFSC